MERDNDFLSALVMKAVVIILFFSVLLSCENTPRNNGAQDDANTEDTTVFRDDNTQ